MPLLILQGKQDTTKDEVKYEIITASNVLVQITKLTLVDNVPSTLNIKMQVLEGPYKNRYVDDRISFDPTNALSWRYRAVRKAVGVPYKESEPVTIDIEQIFLNKALHVDLSVRKGKDKTGNPKDYQAINYRAMAVTTQTSNAISNAKPQTGTIPTVAKPDSSPAAAWEEDLPF